MGDTSNRAMEEYGGHDEEEDYDGDIEDMKHIPGTVILCELQNPPAPFPQKMKIPETSQQFSAVTWCRRTNFLACASETCTKDPSSDQQPVFWIPVHVFDPERITQHAIFSVTAESPADWVQHIEWSPFSCPQVLLVGNYSGRITLWSQPIGSPSVAHANNCWICEYEQFTEKASQLRWLTSPNPYQFLNSPPSGSTVSLEERFFAQSSRSSMRWPNLMCFCAIYYSGSIQLYWRTWATVDQMASSGGSSRQWFRTAKTALGAGPSGIFGADAIITNNGSLIVAAIPVVTPSTVVIWEIHPWGSSSPNGSQALRSSNILVQSQVLLWPGMTPLANYLINWQEWQLHKDSDQAKQELPLSSMQTATTEHLEVNEPLLHCTPIANLSVYVPPDASLSTTFGQSVFFLAFDPTSGGSALVTLTPEGFHFLPENPERGPILSNWRLQRWESSHQPVYIHPLFESGGGGSHNTTSSTTFLSWTKVSTRMIPVRTGSEIVHKIKRPPEEKPKPNVFQRSYADTRCSAKISFAKQGGEFFVSLFGVVHLVSGPSLTLIQSFLVHPELGHPAAVAFSSSGCLVCSTWHCPKTDSTRLRIHYLDPSVTNSSLTWERHIADRFWWCLVCDFAWWDVVACAHALKKDGRTNAAKILAVVDQDFHALPSYLHRQSFSGSVDSFKSRMLEGYDAADANALILDMQARLLLNMLGNAIEASLIDPSTLVSEPWISPNVSGLGADAMAVDLALVPMIQAYVDSILDLASHFLTRLRRYVSFFRMLASHAAASTSPAGNKGQGINLINREMSSIHSGQGPASQSTSGGTDVQTWIQGTMSKSHTSINDSSPNLTANGAAAAGSIGTLWAASTITSTGIPAVRLVEDRSFLHRLCQLVFFCHTFRRRYQSKVAVESRSSMASIAGGMRTLDGSFTSWNEDTIGVASSNSSTLVALNPAMAMENGTRPNSFNSKSMDEPTSNPKLIRMGSGNAGQGYTEDEVKLLFIILGDLCKKILLLAHPLPKSQVSAEKLSYQLHFADGQCNIQPEIVDASLGPYMQLLPRPRCADAAGLLMRELGLHPPAADWSCRVEGFNEWDMYRHDGIGNFQVDQLGTVPHNMRWLRKRRYAERDAALGLNTAAGLGGFTAFLGSRRDVITCIWRASHSGVWHTCNRCGRQTVSLESSLPIGRAHMTPLQETWWSARWAHACPMCNGSWGWHY